MIWKAILMTLAVTILAAILLALCVAMAFILDKPNQIEGEEMLKRIEEEYNKKNQTI